MKGQLSFELLLILLLILSLSIYVSNLYLSTHDTTMAYTIIRDDLTAQINSFEKLASVETIQLINTGNNNNFYVTTAPSSLNEEDFNLLSTKEKVESSTKFSNITITIN